MSRVTGLGFIAFEDQRAMENLAKQLGGKGAGRYIPQERSRGCLGARLADRHDGSWVTARER
jgi:hypothetical protein